MLRLLSVFAVVLMASSVGTAEDKENPYKNAKVGDYMTYKVSHTIAGNAISGITKQTVTATDDKTVTLKSINLTASGKELGTEVTKIDLTKPFDPFEGVLHDSKFGDKFKKTADGKEKLKINNKEYDCRWTGGKVVGEAGGQRVELELKAWFSKAVPFNGLVKLESKGDMVHSTIELMEFGSAKEK